MTSDSIRRAKPLLAVALSLAYLGAPLAAEDPSQVSLDMLELVQPSVSGAYLAGQRALEELRTDEAARYFTDAVEADWENPLLVERAFIALAADGQMDRAASIARHLLELDNTNELAELVVATEAIKQGRYGDAEALLGEVAQDSFSGITAGILQAWSMVGAGRAQEADDLLVKLGQNGLEDFLVFHRALMAETAGDTQRAIDLAAQAFEAEPFVARIVEVYARLLANEGRFDEAMQAIEGFEGQGLAHPVVTHVRDAVREKRKPGPVAPNVQVGAAEMFHGIGVALSRDGSKDLALVFLRLGTYLDPSADVIAMALGELLDSSDQHEAANRIYDAIPANSILKPNAVVRIAQNLDSTGDRPEALRRLKNIVNARPDDLDAVSVLGDLLRYDEQFEESAEAYTKALELSGGEAPADWRFYYVRGISYERAKQWPKAEADFLKALELNPDQPQVLNYLGYSWIDMDMNLDTALGMIEKAVEAQPMDGYIVDSLGWAFYKLGRTEEAVETLERAVMLQPNDPEINDHLGDAYLKAGRALEASFQWKVAASVDEAGNVSERVAPKVAQAEKAREEEERQRIAQYEARKAARGETQDDAAPREAATEETPPVVDSEPQDGLTDDGTAEGSANADDPEQVVHVVKPGDTLWDIARDVYGSGADYRLLVDANLEDLDNPDLIHPGLRLILPKRP